MTALVDIARPKDRLWAACFDTCSVIGGSLLLALSAQLAVPVWFSPVPFTMQLFVVLLMGALLGSRRGTAAGIAYLAEGAAGLPFFAKGAAGPLVFCGPTGGYLLAFPLAIYIIGKLLEKGWRKSYLKVATAMTIGVMLVLTVGWLWLSHFVGYGMGFKLGILPFIVGDLLRVFVVSGLVTLGWQLRRS